jgi:hypothetical protein
MRWFCPAGEKGGEKSHEKTFLIKIVFIRNTCRRILVK